MANKAYEKKLNMSLGNCKLKQRDTNIHQLEQLIFKTLTAANAGADVEQQELSLTAGGNAKSYSHFRR